MKRVNAFLEYIGLGGLKDLFRAMAFALILDLFAFAVLAILASVVFALFYWLGFVRFI